MRKTIAIVGFLLVFSLIAIAMLLRYYSEDCKRIIVQKINQQYGHQVQFDSIGNLSICQWFPNVSISLYNVRVKNPLLKANLQRLDVSIQLLRLLLEEEIIVNGISLNKGTIMVDHAIFEGEESDFKLHWRKIKLTELVLDYHYQNQKYSVNINAIHIKQKKSKQQSVLISGLVDDLQLDKIQIPIQKDEYPLSIKMHINLWNKDELSLKTSLLETKTQSLEANFRYNWTQNTMQSDDFVYKGPLDIVKLADIEGLKEVKTGDVELSGSLYFVQNKPEKMDIQWALSAVKLPKGKTNNSNIMLRNCKGNILWNNHAGRFDLQEADLLIENNLFELRGVIEGFDGPHIQFQLEGSGDLKNWANAKTSNFKELEGQYEVKINGSQVFESWNQLSVEAFANNNLEVKGYLKRLNLPAYAIEVENAELNLKDEFLVVYPLRFSVFNDFLVGKLQINNIKAVVFSEESPIIKADFLAERISLDHWAPVKSSDDKSGSPTVEVNFLVERMTYKEQVFEDMHFTVSQQKQMGFDITIMEGKWADGQLMGRFNMGENNSIAAFNFKGNSLNSKNITQLMNAVSKPNYSLEVEGKINTTITGALAFDSVGNIISKDSKAEVLVESPRFVVLNNTQLDELVEYIRIHKILGKVLDYSRIKQQAKQFVLNDFKVQFQVLDNQIIYPRTSFNTNIGAFESVGIFAEKDMNVSFGFFPGDFLKRKNDVFEVEPENGELSKVFIRIKGPYQNLSFSHDMAEKKQELKRNWESQKTDLKQIIASEKKSWAAQKDSSSNKTIKPAQSSSKGELIWEELEETPKSNTQTPMQENKSEKKSKKPNKKWLNSSELEEETEQVEW